MITKYGFHLSSMTIMTVSDKKRYTLSKLNFYLEKLIIQDEGGGGGQRNLYGPHRPIV